jgi:hypothetical protein
MGCVRVLDLKFLVFLFFLMKGMWNLASALMIVDMEKTQIGCKDTLSFRSTLIQWLNSEFDALKFLFFRITYRHFYNWFLGCLWTQVILKPDPGNSQDLFIRSLSALGSNITWFNILWTTGNRLYSSVSLLFLFWFSVISVHK